MNNEAFKPYLECYGEKIGYIGEETNLSIENDKKLYVGDVVEVYAEVYGKYSNLGKTFICKINDEGFVLGLSESKFKNGVYGKWRIGKIKSFKDLENGETYLDVKAILKEVLENEN